MATLNFNSLEYYDGEDGVKAHSFIKDAEEQFSLVETKFGAGISDWERIQFVGKHLRLRSALWFENLIVEKNQCRSLGFKIPQCLSSWQEFKTEFLNWYGLRSDEAAEKLLSLKMGPNEPTQDFIARFSNYAQFLDKDWGFGPKRLLFMNALTPDLRMYLEIQCITNPVDSLESLYDLAKVNALIAKSLQI